MPISTEESVKLICVKYKSSDSLSKVKLKLLRGMRKAERRSSSSCGVAHPLQPWTSRCRSIGDLPADDVLTTSSNSRYIAFLTKDGRVCRLRCTSRPELSQKGDSSVGSMLDSLRRSQGVSFQEESDAEYARQLQAEFEAEGHHRLLRGGPPHSPFYGRASSPSTVLEELDREARAYMYLGMTAPNPWEQTYRVSPRFMIRDESPVPIGAMGRDSGAADARSGDSPPPDYHSLFGERRYINSTRYKQYCVYCSICP